MNQIHIPAAMLTALIVYRPYVGSHNLCEFMSSIILKQDYVSYNLSAICVVIQPEPLGKKVYRSPIWD